MRKLKKYISSAVAAMGFCGLTSNANYKNLDNDKNVSVNAVKDNTEILERISKKQIKRKKMKKQNISNRKNEKMLTPSEYENDDEYDIVDEAIIAYKRFFKKHQDLKSLKNFIINLSAYKFLTGCFHSKLAKHGFEKRFSDISDVSNYDERVQAFLREAFIFSRDYRFINCNPVGLISYLSWFFNDAVFSGINFQSISSASRMEIIQHGACTQAALTMKYWMDQLGIHGFIVVYEGHYFATFNANEDCSGPWRKIELVPNWEKRLGIDQRILMKNGIFTNKQIYEQSKKDENGKSLGFFERRQRERDLLKRKHDAYEEFAKNVIKADMIPEIDRELECKKIYIISDDKRVLPYEIFRKVNPRYLKTVFNENGTSLVGYFIGLKASDPKVEYLQN